MTPSPWPTSVTRRGFLRTSVAGLAALGLPCGLRGTETASLRRAADTTTAKPNFLFILIDDLGWTDLGCYGNTFIDTPNLDRLARESMRFTDAYAAAPVCSPTRASILTGQSPARTGMYEVVNLPPRPHARMVPPPNRSDLPPSAITIAEALRGAGYVSGCVGKWHVGRRPADEGFAEPAAEPLDGDLAALAGRTPQKRVGPITAEAVQFLRRHRDRPFFLWLNHHAVHAPLEARPDLVRKYEARAEAQGVKSIHPAYAAMVEMVDESVGQVLEALDDLRLAGRTVVLFFSDNGGLIDDLVLKTPLATCNAPLRSQKGDLYEGGIRVPMLVRWPGAVTPAAVCREPVISDDFFPTILEMAGAVLPPGHVVDGRSLVPLLRQHGKPDRESLYWHFPTCSWTRSPMGAIRRGRYKLIEFFEDGRVELYDLASDLGEQNDLARTLPEKVQALRAELRQWRESVGAAMPAPNPRYDPAHADVLPPRLGQGK